MVVRFLVVPLGGVKITRVLVSVKSLHTRRALSVTRVELAVLEALGLSLYRLNTVAYKQ